MDELLEVSHFQLLHGHKGHKEGTKNTKENK